MLMTGVVTVKPYTFIVYLLIFIINFLIAILSYPIAIRLSAELYKQILKYKKIVQQYRLDEDVIQYIGYCDHFKVIYCLILSLILYLSFTIISSVNGVYMLCLYKDLNKNAYRHYIHTLGTSKLFSKNMGSPLVLKYLTIPTNNYVLYTIEAFKCVGQDSIILFASVFIYQIVCYFQRRNFSLFFFLKIYIIRIIFVIFWNTNVLFPIIQTFNYSTTIKELIMCFYIPFPIFRKLIELFENGLLTGISIALVRVAYRTINIKETSHNNDNLIIREIGIERYEKVQLSIKLFKIFCIGYISTVVLIFVINILECHFIFLFLSFDKNYKVPQFETTQISVGIITGLLGILPTFLYILFLWKLWFYYGKVFGKNKFRFRLEDFDILNSPPADLLNNPHLSKLPNQDRIILIHHTVVIFITSILISGFCSQLLSIRWTAPLTLKPGDYLLTNETGSVLSCDGRLEYSLSYSPISLIDPTPYHNRYGFKGKDCTDSIRFYSPPLESYYITQQISMANISKLVYFDIWLPERSYIHNISGCIQRIVLYGQKIPFPCYLPIENLYSSQADELCYRYYNNNETKFDIDAKNSTCEENRSSCTTNLVAIFRVGCVPDQLCTNPSVNFTIERPVLKGIETSEMCDFNNISNCNSQQIRLMIYEPRDLYFSKDELRGSNSDLCLFSAVCHYSLWIPILASIGILSLSLTYAVTSLVLIHRYLT